MKNIDVIIPIGPLCVPAELLKHNNARFCSFPFDWARSNILSVIDVIKNGHEWHINNNIDKQGTIKYEKYHFDSIFYPHHDYITDRDYMIRCSSRLFNALKEPSSIIFLYMANREHIITNKEIMLFDKTIKSKYKNIKYKIVVAEFLSIGEDISLKYKDKNCTIFTCKAPKQFYSNNMTGEYYKHLFDTILPYNLNTEFSKNL